MQAEKRRLRAQAKRTMEGFEAEYLHRSDEAIFQRVLALPEYIGAKTVFVYVSVGREVDTRALIGAALAAGKTVCVPRCLSGGVMEARAILSMEDLRPAKMGLLESDETAPLIPPEQIDLVLAPCLAVDRIGVRLGQGGGYYDCFLRSVGCPVACLCRSPLLWGALPREPWDVPVAVLLTEDEVLRPAEGDWNQAPGVV